MRSIRLLALTMIAAVAIVAALAWWDARRESDAALEDFGAERVVLASSIAGQLGARLADARRDALVIAEDRDAGRPTSMGVAGRYLRVAIRAPGEAAGAAADDAILLSVPLADGRVVDETIAAADLFRWLARDEQPGVRVLVRVPGERGFRGTDGARVADDALAGALDAGLDHARVERDRAGQLGLPVRTAMAGLATVDAAPFGRWSVAAIASAERERDRDRRLAWRLVLAILVAGALVGAFGGLAIRVQRKEAELERELAARQAALERDERLERLDRAATMVTLASGVAHELSTPLGVIVGRAEQLLASGGASADAKHERAVRAILDQAGRIDGVVRGFLGLARGAPPQVESVAPGAIVDAARALVEHRFARAGVALVVRKPDDELATLRCDRRLVEHALINLLLNACDACARGGKVEVAIEDVPDAATVRFVVTDDGAGIDPAHVERALEPFFTTKPTGTGLGLAIANEIMKSHHGALSIGPASPRGTRACLSLPVGEERAHAA